jgi:adenosylcobinamide kinase/adenosylcobinamide-phosphate guanylyltransferase
VSLVVLLGGARSGKSSLALELARERERPVTVVATAEPRDDEMRRRIVAHRSERPANWETVEAPLEIEAAIAAVSPDATVVIDCLTLWVANLQESGLDENAILAAGSKAAATAGGRPGLAVAVSNEVGLGIVPANSLARAYRDLLGAVNRLWLEAADEAWFVVAGKRLRLE